MEDYFAAMDAAEIREKYWGEDSNDFYAMAIKPGPVKKSRRAGIFSRQPLIKKVPQESTLAFTEIQYDHYGLAGLWTLEPKPQFLPNPYFVGQKIELDIGLPGSACPFAGECLLVEVLQLLGTPWASGCVMKVKCIRSPQQQDLGHDFVLKIIDPRFCLHRWGANLTCHNFQRFVDMLLCGRAKDFWDDLLADSTRASGLGWWLNKLSNWQKLLALSHHAQTMARGEASAYAHLRDLQGYHIPTFHYEVCTRPWIEVPANVRDLVRTCGFLIEYIEGNTLENPSPRHDASLLELYDEAVRTSNVFEYYGFRHNSMAKRNILVRKQRQSDGSRIVFIDFFRHSLYKSEDGYAKYPFRSDSEVQLVDDLIHRTNKPQQWARLLLAGRMGERTTHVLGRNRSIGVFDQYFYTTDSGKKVELGPFAIARIRYRVIMDDIWHIQRRPISDADLETKVLLSRVAYQIIQEEAGYESSARQDWQIWYQRALPRIAHHCGYQTGGLIRRFEHAVQAYIQRPNKPGTSLGAAWVAVAIKTLEVEQKLPSSSESSTKSINSPALTTTSSHTSLDPLELDSELSAYGNLERIFVPDPARWADPSSLEAVLKAWLSEKNQETKAA